MLDNLSPRITANESMISHPYSWWGLFVTRTISKANVAGTEIGL